MEPSPLPAAVAGGTDAQNAPPDREQVVLGKVTRRLIPFIALLYAFNILDRTNIGIAALTMKPDLHFSDTVYGIGVGMFFIGYFFFELPSNLIMERVGARIWITRIMFTWGVISSAMLFVHSVPWFYALRFLLGVAEAGFYPGIILYLTYWFPTVQRARAVARFVAVSAIVGVISGPISGALLLLDGHLGLKGWQWLFLAEGVPSCLLSVLALIHLTDRPEKAHWLAADEREWLVARLASERARRDQLHGFPLFEALRSPLVLFFSLLFFLWLSASNGVGFFAPQIFKAQTDWSNQKIATITSLPGLAGAIAMLISAASSDRHCERKWHFAVGAFISTAGVLLAAVSPNPWVTVLALVVVNIGTGTCQGPFWAMPTSVLSGAAAAGSIAFINSCGNLGGFAGPYLMGSLKDATHTYETGMFVLAGVYLITGIQVLFASHDPAQERAARAASRSHEVEAAAPT